jgi:beta-fructofuranosidase
MTHGAADLQCGAAGRLGGAGRPRPALHFAPVRGWMNDPNGLIQWNGRVHLFYQHNPAGPVQENIAWGHASSTDLWTWQDHPLALEPDPAGPDRDGCYSGCAVVAGGRPRLLYTGVNGQRELPCLAEAADQDLVRWTRDPGNPVISSPPPGEAVRAFRDHSAWRDGPAWYQVVGGGLEDRGGALFLYRSADLRHWQYAGVFAAAADYGLDGVIWECPDVFVLGDTTVVVVSVWDGQPPYAMWMTGQVSGHRFVPKAFGRCDDGHRYYAPQSLTLADGRRVAFGWLRECLGELAGPDTTRVGAMSLPRELFLDSAGTLQSRPVGELDRARRETLLTRLVHRRATAGVTLSATAACATEISLTPVGCDVTAAGLRLTGPGSADVQVQVTADGIEITEGGRRLTGTAAPRRAGTSADAPVGQIRAWYDGGILEVFSPPAAAAAVICRRDGRYDQVEAEITGRPGAPPGRARFTAWSCGRPSGG